MIAGRLTPMLYHFIVVFSVIKSECKSEMDVEVSTVPDMVPVMNWDMTGCELPDSLTDTSTGWH